MTEYIKLEKTEKAYTKKHILQSEISLLNSVKRYQEYRKLRKQELLMKILFKEKLEDIKNSLVTFDRFLPRVKNHNFKEEEELDKEHHTLEQELDEIKKKLEKLHD